MAQDPFSNVSDYHQIFPIAHLFFCFSGWFPSYLYLVNSDNRWWHICEKLISTVVYSSSSSSAEAEARVL